MRYWLFKTEPHEYSFADLERDGVAEWDGVTANPAQAQMRQMAEGDLCVIYHTGDERSAVGVAKVVSAPYPDPKADDEKIVVVDVQLVKKLPRPVSLSDFKADPAFAGWDLLRIGRLGVVPVPDPMWDRLLELSKSDGGAAPKATAAQIKNKRGNAK